MTVTTIDHSGFNPRPCGRGDPAMSAMESDAKEFQSTPLWEGRPWPPWACLCPWWFQSTPLWEGRLGLGRAPGPGEGVSIHAPVGGATNLRTYYPFGVPVSIHAPVGGATLQAGIMACLC